MKKPILLVLNVAQSARSLQSAQIIKDSIARTGRDSCQTVKCADSENTHVNSGRLSGCD